MVRRGRRVRMMRLATVGALGAGLFAAVAGPSSADVTSVTGSAFGVSIPNLTIFGGTPPGVPFGPIPSVTLAADASNSPQTATVPSTSAVFGPATIFSSGPITVNTEGTLGAGGSVTSTADIDNVNASGQEVFTASSLQSTCTASEAGVSGSTTVTGGRLQTSEGDPAVEGDETFVDIPTNPAVNETHQGTIEAVGDTFEYIFNEQITNPDGSLTVYAAHLRLLGPTAVGDLFIGRVDCGVTATATTTTTVGTGATTTTVGTGVTTTTVGTGATTTTVGTGATTTTVGTGVTTTTRPGATTTTVSPSVSPTVPPPGKGGSPLVRTGSTFQSLVLFALLTLVVGALTLIGFGNRLASAGSASGPWGALVRHAVERRQRRRPWNRRRWS